MRPVAWPAMKIGDMVLKPIGMGSGMLGIPGDITPPSRFIRAVAFSQTARKTTGAYDTVREAFRILDNFNVPIEEVNPKELEAAGLEPARFSGTQYTSAYDMKHLVLYYHTDNNRTVRKVNLKAIDFSSLKKSISTSLRGNGTGVVDVTPKWKLK
jgi:choloylglycine hydrolase